MSKLDETDILLWSDRQAALLRSVAAGERPTEPPDWANIVEEVQSVGKEALFAVQSLLVQAMLHMLKADAWPLSRDVDHWRAEARRFRGTRRLGSPRACARKSTCRSSTARPLRAMPKRIDGQLPLPVPTVCPVALEELVAE
jgi:hypothetical protein